MLTTCRIEAFEDDICETRLHKVEQVDVLGDGGLGVRLDHTDVVDSSASYLGYSPMHQGFQEARGHLWGLKTVVRGLWLSRC